MKYLSLLCFCLFLSLSAPAQEINRLKFDLHYLNDNYKDKYESLEGSPFYNEDWIRGYVLLNSGEKSNTTDLIYSTYSNQVLFKQNGEVLAVTPNTLNGFVLFSEDGKVTFKNGFKSKKYDISSNLLLEVIHNGSVKLVAQHVNRVKEHRETTGRVVKKFDNRIHYFLVDPNNTFHRVELKEDKILNALGNHQDELKLYAKNNSLDFEEKSDVKKILNEYEKITQDSK